MNPNVTYASRKRRKPVQKIVKPSPAEGVKSNPSKRHRDRLNAELDRLASLLPFPQDVIAKLDKLSVLRLSVSYLRAKSFFDGDNGFSQPATYYNPDQLPPENSSFMERNFICRLRCLLDNSSGFLAMNFQGRLKFLHGQNKKGKDGATLSPQLALFAVATPLQPPSILEIRTKNFIFRTKHKLDFTPTGCDAKGKIVLGYTEAELCMRGTGYQFVHAADMLYCAENHVRMMKTGESGMTVFRLLTKENRWAWVQANARLVYKNGRPDYIIATQRPLTDEEGAEHLRKRNMKLPFMFATGEAVLYEVSFPMSSLMDPSQPKSKNTTGKGAKATLHSDSVDPNSLLGAMLRQDESVYLCPPASHKLSFERNFFSDSRDELGGGGSSSWTDNLLPSGNHNILKRELVECSQDSTVPLPEDSAALFQDNKTSDLYSIMKNLGIDFEDLKCIQQDEEFFKTELSGMDDIGDIDITDEILTYVQDSLNKSDFLYSGCNQQQPMVQNEGCLVQQELNPHQLHQHQKQLMEQQQQQQQLCQKMKHMQVNGMFTNWSSGTSMPLSCSQQQQQPQQYVFPGVHATTSEFSYKSEVNTSPYACRQEFIPYKQPAAVMPQLSNFAQMDFPVAGFDRSTCSASSNLEDFLSCLQQVPENRECGIGPESVMLTPQTCYAGAVSMYQCAQEAQPSCVDQMQYDPVMASQQTLLNKFQNGLNGGNVNEAYPSQLDAISNAQTATHLQPLHHPTEPRSFSDLASSGFM
ncbi:aryl hydrocarbon receptor isoform X3 [Calypte anna]|uniref:aryl hydrocarbon receptor isoform X3 n=1 Tax=Calypte anna TaxID=9244 RepID=UPI0011C3E62C|nr:aryl hydrocarbon receptor isoform X3 [Calypte anna]